MRVCITVSGDPQDCRDTIYKLRLVSELKISTIYEQCIETRWHANYYIVLDEVGSPKWSLENLPDPDSFFREVKRYSWGEPQ
jgi:hypothetical protein